MADRMQASIVIVGAGPAGLATAIHLGQLGVRDVVLVDRHDFPRDKTCGSAVSPKGIETLARLGVRDAVAARAHPIRGLRLVTPRGHSLDLFGHTDAAMILCRRSLDHLLLTRAQEMGVRFVPHFQASWLLQRGDRVGGVAAADGRDVQARFTVVADGAHSRLGPDRGPRRLIQAIMGWWEGVPFRPNRIDMIFDDLVKPYYGWMFPEGPDRVNIGICYDDPRLERNARQVFTAFLDKHYAPVLAGARQVGRWKGHPVSWSAKVGPLTSSGRFVVGEAGRMTHPGTAEGIYQGMHSGILAAEALAGILDGRANEAYAAQTYEARCSRAFARSFAGAAHWCRLVDIGGLDVIARAANLGPVQRALARSMATM